MRRYAASAAAWCGLAVLAMTAPATARPVPIGSSTTTVSYPTATGVVSYSGDRNYMGTGFSDATNLDGAPNIRTFNSANIYGRRTDLQASHPMFSHVLGPDESLLAHAFLKIDNGAEYFPGLLPGSDVTVSVSNIRFNEPVTVDRSTFLFHTLWRADQADRLQHPYHHLHNLHTADAAFRDLDDFLAGAIFSDTPEPNYLLGDTAPVFTGEGTETLGFSITFPYNFLKNLEEEGLHPPPAGLPAPGGFLEPYHIHFEYTVVPEPGVLVLLALGLPVVHRAGRRRRWIARRPHRGYVSRRKPPAQGE